MHIKIFRQLFTDKVLEILSKQGYVYKKSREVFERVVDEHIYNIYVYMYKRSTFIEIETKVFYGNKAFIKELKQKGINLPYNDFCGGDIEFLCSYYFKKEFPEKYDNLIFMLNEDPGFVIKDWLGYYESIMVPFLENCKNSKLLNEMVNNDTIDTVGLNTTYETRVFYSYFVGKRAGVYEEELLKLANLYVEEIRSWGVDIAYLEKYIKLKEELFELGDEKKESNEKRIRKHIRKTNSRK